MSNTLPWRTLAKPSRPSDFSAPSIALPCGSKTLAFKVTTTLVFIETPRSSRMRSRRHRQQRINGRGVARAAQWAGDAGVTQGARNRSERLEMVGARSRRRDQQEDQVDGQPVQRLEIDRALQPREHAANALAARQFAMRY